MKNSLRRLLIRHSIQRRDDAFKLSSGGESWIYCDVGRTVRLPHGLYAVGSVLLDAFLTHESDDKGLTVSAIAGVPTGGQPLAASLLLASYAYDQENAPSLVTMLKQLKSWHTLSPVEGADHLEPGAGILVIEDVVTSGGSTTRTIETLRHAGLTPLLVIALVDREVGGLDAIKAATEIEAISVYTLSQLATPSVDDHVLFMADPNDDAPGGTYLIRVNDQGWQPCDTDQNTYLHSCVAQHIVYEPGEGEDLAGADEVGDVFYIEGVLKP